MNGIRFVKNFLMYRMSLMQMFTENTLSNLHSAECIDEVDDYVDKSPESLGPGVGS